MSGPKTASYGLSRALRRQLAEQERLRTEQRRKELEAQRRRQTLQTAIVAARLRLDRLSDTLAQTAAQFPDETLTLPQRTVAAPASTDDNDLLQAQLDTLTALASEQEQALHRELARVSANASLRATLGALLSEASAEAPRSAAAVLAKPTTSAVPKGVRCLQRLDLNAGEQAPAALLDLAEQLDRTSPVQSSVLAAELSYQIQTFNAGRAALRRDCAEATELFAGLPEPQSADERALAACLSRAALGTEPLDPAVRVAVADWQARAAARATQQQAAQVLRESLQELGYEVEEGFTILFVERGMVHFTRPEWSGYYVRLRANAAEQYLNFNLVRAAAGPETLEQGRRDHEAEACWCQGYRPLLERLAAQGLSIQPIRELPAGAMAVQTVEPAQLGLGKSSRDHQTPAAHQRSRR